MIGVRSPAYWDNLPHLAQVRGDSLAVTLPQHLHEHNNILHPSQFERGFRVHIDVFHNTLHCPDHHMFFVSRSIITCV
jgi:hypothetical protein